MIREYVKDYAHVYDDGEDSDEEGEAGPRGFKNDRDDLRRAETAVEVFETLFGSKEEFLEEWAHLEREDFVGMCQPKCSIIIQENKVDGKNIARTDGATADELLQKLKPFMVNEKSLPQLWPPVDYVTIRLDHELLRYGAIVIYVPDNDSCSNQRKGIISH